MPPPSRRTTLGPVSANRRTTIDENTPNLASMKPPKARMSMLPRVGREAPIPPSPAGTMSSASSRRRSVGGDRRQSFVPPPTSMPMVKSDPRPITDKAYQNQCIRLLLQYLTQAGYDYPISPKTLARPSGKDFSNIVGFMLRKLDPTFQDGTMKFEDEVAMNFKAMGYPYPISKTALVAAGSPHTWPALLGALTWLMEHLKCLEVDQFSTEEVDEVGKSFQSLEDLERKTDRAFFKFLSNAYTAFLRGDQTMTEHLEEGLVDMFERDNMVIEREIERVTDLNATIVEQINHMGQQSQSLPSLSKKREDYATDLEQFHDLVRQMDEHKAALDQKVKERTAELESTNLQLGKITSKIASLKEKVRTQELSVEDVRKMQSQQLRLKEALARATAIKQQHKDAMWRSDLELTKLFEELNAVVDIYNIKVAELALLVDDAEQMFKIKMDVKKHNAHQGDQSLLLGVDLFAGVRPVLSHYKADALERMSKSRRELQEVLDGLEASEEALTEALDKLHILEDKKAKCEETLNREKDQQEATLAVRLREVDCIESKIASLRDPAALEEQIARYQRQCTQLEALRMKHEDENVSQKKAIHDEIISALQTVNEHNEYVKSKLAELKQYVIQKKSSIGKLTIPTEIKIGN